MIFTLDGRLRLTDCPAALRRALMEELTICMRCRAMS